MANLSNLRKNKQTQQRTTGLDSAGVLALSGTGIAVYDTLDSLPTSNIIAGSKALVNDVNRLYVSDGSGWYNSGFNINLSPSWVTEPSATYEIVDSATPLIITALASDSDNLINQSFASDSAQYMVDISSDSSVFTFTPKSADSIGIEVANGNLTDSNGDFTYTFKWSDGINVLSAPAIITYSPGAPASQDASFTLSASSTGTTTTTPRTMSASTSGPYPLLPPDADNGSVRINNVPMYSFVVPGTEPFTLRCYQAQGSAGSATVANGGEVWYYDVTITPTVANSKIYMRPGQRGYRSYQTATDGTSGGSGGLGQVWIQDDTNGNRTADDGNNVSQVLLVAGSGGGNDRSYQGYITYGQDYPTLTTTTGFGLGNYANLGVTYTRSGAGTAYGGYPNGQATDDNATTTTSSANIVNTNYCSNYAMSSNYYQGYATYSNAVQGKFDFVGKVVAS